MIVVVSWSIGNNLVFLSSILVGSMIMIVFWSYDCDSFLVISTSGLVIMIVSWAVGKIT